MSRREGRRVAVNRGTRTPVDAISEIRGCAFWRDERDLKLRIRFIESREQALSPVLLNLSFSPSPRFRRATSGSTRRERIRGESLFGKEKKTEDAEVTRLVSPYDVLALEFGKPSGGTGGG